MFLEYWLWFGGRRGIRWTLTSILEDLDYADDIALLAHRYQDMQAKTNVFSANTAGSLGLKINTKKTRHLRMNNRTNESIMVNGEVVAEVDQFTYLGSKVSTSGDGEEEILVRISKASQAFAWLRGTQIQEYQPENKDPILQKQCPKHSTVWRGDGLVMCCACHQQHYHDSTSRPQICRWTPDGRRKWGRPKEIWRKTVEKEMKENSWTWSHLERQPMAHSGRGLMCFPTREGLSK